MFDIKIAASRDEIRNVWLSLPADTTERLAVLNKMCADLPAGITIAFDVVEVRTEIPYVCECVKHGATIDELNLLSYLLENMGEDKRSMLYDLIDNAAPRSFDKILDEAVLLKYGGYEVWDNVPEPHDVGVEYINKEYPDLPEILFTNLDFEGIASDLEDKGYGLHISGSFLRRLDNAHGYDKNRLSEYIANECREYERNSEYSTQQQDSDPDTGMNMQMLPN